MTLDLFQGAPQPLAVTHLASEPNWAWRAEGHWAGEMGRGLVTLLGHCQEGARTYWASATGRRLCRPLRPVDNCGSYEPVLVLFH